MSPRGTDLEIQPLIEKDEVSEDEIVTVEHRISEWQAAASFAKVIMGAGSFALPWAFSKIGYIAGPAFLMGLVIISVPSLKLLVECSRKTRFTSSYVDVAHAVLGNTGSRLTLAASVFASIGVCGSYLVFLATTLSNFLFPQQDPSAPDEGRQSILVFAVLPLVIMLAAARNMQNSSWISLFGDISVVLGMIAVVIYGMLEIARSDSLTSKMEDVVAVGKLSEMPIALGTVGYLFLVHMAGPPIYSSMERPENVGSMLWWTFGSCAIISSIFGVLGYLAFGSSTSQIVISNVRSDGSSSFAFVSIVQLMLCIDLLLTYPIVMRPSIIIVEQCLPGQFITNIDRRRLFVSVLLGLIAAGASLLIPQFAVLSGLVGGVSLSFLALVLPPVMHWKLSASQGRLLLLREIPNIIAFVVGVALMCWTIYAVMYV